MYRKIVVLLVFLFSMNLLSENHWVHVGDSLNNNLVYDMALVFGAAETMFISFQEQEYVEGIDGPYYASVKKYNTVSKTWDYLGIPKFSPELQGGWMDVISPLSLVISNEKPFIVYVTGNAPRSREIKTYTKNNNQWEYLDDNIPSGDGLTLLRTDKNGKLYLAFASISTSGTKDGITVISSDNGSEWEYCGKHPIDVSLDDFFKFIISPQGVPIISGVSPRLPEDDSSGAVVYSYDVKSEEWHQLGKRGFYGSIDEYVSSIPYPIASDDGELFCYFSISDHKEVEIMKYDSVTDSWKFLPSVNMPPETLSWRLSINHNSDFFFSLRSGVDAITKIMKYNFALSEWEMIGDEIVGLTCSAPVFNEEDRPFLSCRDKESYGVVLSLDNSVDEDNVDEDNVDEDNVDEDTTSVSSGNGSACTLLLI